MISYFDIEGFQCHRHIRVKLDPYVTVFVGDNGAGKSALVRTLKWLLLNQWDSRADQMTTWDMDHTIVKARVDKHEIIRSKGKDGNLYILDGKVLEAVGAGKVPDAIAKITNVSEENFQEQLDPAFWFHLTAGQVAKSLNRIVNLSSIDSSLDNVAGELREAREAVKVTQSRLKEAREIKKSLGWSAQADLDLQALEGKYQELANGEARIANLTLGLAQAEEMSRIKQNASGVILSGLKAVTLGQEFYAVARKTRSLVDLVSQAQTQEVQTCELRKRLVMAQKQLDKMKGSLCQVCQGTGYSSLHSVSATST